MGSIITLGIDDFNLDWGQNDGFADRSSLFLAGDVETVIYHYGVALITREIVMQEDVECDRGLVLETL